MTTEAEYNVWWKRLQRMGTLLVSIVLFVYGLITNIRYAATLEDAFDPSTKLQSRVTSASQSPATFPVYSIFLVLGTISGAYQLYYQYWLNVQRPPPFKVKKESLDGLAWWSALNPILNVPNVVLTMIGIPNLVISESDWEPSAQAIASFGASSAWALFNLVKHAHEISVAEDGRPAAPRAHMLLAVFLVLAFGFVGVILAGWYFMFYGIAGKACGKFFIHTMEWVAIILLLIIGYAFTLLHAMSLSRTYMTAWQDRRRLANSNGNYLRIGSALLLAAFIYCAQQSWSANRPQWTGCYDEDSAEGYYSDYVYQSSPDTDPYTGESSYDGAGPVHQSDVDRAVSVYTAATIISGIMAFFAACFLVASRSESLRPTVTKERRPNDAGKYDDDLEMTSAAPTIGV